MMNYYLNCLLLLYTITGFSQNDGLYLDKETKETIEWLNSKLIEHQFETSKIKHIQYFESVREIKGSYYLMGEQTQHINTLVMQRVFAIPIEKINSISFEDKEYNIWINIRMKNHEEAVLTSSDGENWTKVSNLPFIFSKSIDNENLRPRLKKAFEYLMKLYGNKTEEKF